MNKKTRKYITFVTDKPLTLAEYNYLAKGLRASAPLISEMKPGDIAICSWQEFYSKESWRELRDMQKCDTVYWIDSTKGQPLQCSCGANQFMESTQAKEFVYIFGKDS